MSPLVESLTSGDRANVGGVLCNDPSGLCLMAKGTMRSDSDSGVYTGLVRLASRLSPSQEASDSSGSPPAPLITIETESNCTLVKEYNGHTVAVKVPSTTVPTDPSED